MSVVFSFGADYVEALVELDVYLAAVVEGDFDFVVALLVTNLGLGDTAAAGVGESGRRCLFQVSSRDWCIGCVVVDRFGG